MDLKSQISHWCLSQFYSRKRAAFRREARNLETVQRARLATILKTLGSTERWGQISTAKTYEEFCERVPLHDDSNFASDIETQRQSGRPILSSKVLRWEPTSGSTASRKWIPYTEQHLDEMNAAAAVWLGDLYRSHPRLRGGKHYWSLSWLPEDLRPLTTANDEELFPFYQRWLLKNTMLMPAKVSTLPTARQSLQATALLLLGEENLRLMFVWSPTFLLQILETITERWSELTDLLQAGSWGSEDAVIRKAIGPAPRRNLNGVAPGEWRRVWPELEVVSAWDSSSSRPWADKLKAALPEVTFQGKGLWATEGVVTIPFEDQKPLAFQSHFYEFIDLANHDVVPGWKVKKNSVYQPVLSSSNGLLRNKLSDRLICTGFLESVPCFEFLGRIHSVDLVGEKLSLDFVTKVFEPIREHEPICLLALHHPKPHYVLVCGKPGQVDIEALLCEQHHYKLARELGQLEAATVVHSENPARYLSRIRAGRTEGQLKMDQLIEIKHNVEAIPL